MSKTVAHYIASHVQSMIFSVKRNNIEAYNNNLNVIKQIIHDFMPSGSGFDAGTEFIFEKSSPAKLVFRTAFHHLDENGTYTGWSAHNVTLISCFDGPDVKVTGRDFNDIKEYIGTAFLEHATTLIKPEYVEPSHRLKYVRAAVGE